MSAPLLTQPRVRTRTPSPLVVLALVVLVAVLLPAPPAHALTAPFPLQLPYPLGVSMRANGPHAMDASTGIRNSVDFGSANGSTIDVVAAADGVVSQVEDCGGGYEIRVDHAEGWQTGYFHLSRADVAEGDRVTRGETLGATGYACGRASFNHVHFSVRIDGDDVDLDGLVIGGHTLESEPGDYNGQWYRNSDGAHVAGSVCHNGSCGLASGDLVSLQVGETAARSVSRIAGASRIETAARLALEVFPDGAEVVYLAEQGTGLAETLAAGMVTDGPVLLTPGSGPSPAVLADTVATLDPDRVVALGDDGQVTDAVLTDLAAGRPTDRIAGEDVHGTAAALALEVFPHGSDTVYLAEAVNLADGLAGGVVVDGPVLLVPTDGTVPAVVADAVRTLGPRTVTALGGRSVVSDEVLAEVAGDRRTTRLAGGSRFETAAAVAAHVFGDRADTVYLARHDIAPDAVVAGSVTDGPILLVESCNGVHPATRAAIDRLEPRRVVVLGGTSAVCNATLYQAAG